MSKVPLKDNVKNCPLCFSGIELSVNKKSVGTGVLCVFVPLLSSLCVALRCLMDNMCVQLFYEQLMQFIEERLDTRWLR